MRFLLTQVLMLCFFASFSQQLFIYKDTVDKFAIGIPAKWKFGKSKQSSTIKLFCTRLSTDSLDKPHENFNLSIVSTRSLSLEMVYHNITQPDERTQFLMQGDTTIDGQHFKWFIETHKNELDTSISMKGLTYVSYYQGKAYILSFYTFEQHFNQFSGLFKQVASSFRISLPKTEKLIIHLPGIETWQKIYDNEDSATHTIQMLPPKENASNWTTILNFLYAKQVHVTNIDQAIQSYKKASLAQSALAKFTLLKKNNDSSSRWALFKVETPSFPNDPAPESQLYYIIQGKRSLITVFTAVREKELSADFVAKWSELFLNSEVVEE